MTAGEVKGLREGLGLTQEQLAHRLGVSFATVNRWEKGRHVPTGLSLKTLRKLQGRTQSGK